MPPLAEVKDFPVVDIALFSVSLRALRARAIMGF